MVRVAPEVSSRAVLTVGRGQGPMVLKASTVPAGAAVAPAATLDFGADGKVTIAPKREFFMLGLGYTHPTWGHGVNQGELKVEREDFVAADLDRATPQHLHVQALSDVTYVDGAGRTRKGRGVFEQLAIGPHAPSGFASILDMAP